MAGGMSDHGAFKDQPHGLDCCADGSLKYSIATVEVVEGLRKIKYEKLLAISLSHDISDLIDHSCFGCNYLSRRGSINYEEVLMFHVIKKAFATTFLCFFGEGLIVFISQVGLLQRQPPGLSCHCTLGLLQG